MAMRKGYADSEEHSKYQSSSRLQFLTIAEGQIYVVRFYDERTEWPVVDTHILASTKDVPANRKDTNMKWPKQMTGVCPEDPWFITSADGDPVITYEDGFGDCYIHKNYGDKLDNFKRPQSAAATTTYARVILREKVPSTDGGPPSFRDKMEDFVGEDGTRLRVPAIRVVSYSWSRLFAAVAAGAYEDDSVRTKDYLIEKKGKDFAVSAMSITPGHHPGLPSWEFYDQAMTATGFDLIKLLRYQASQEWYRLWFIPGPWDFEKLEKEADGAGSQVADKPAEAELTDEQKALKAEYEARLAAIGKRS